MMLLLFGSKDPLLLPITIWNFIFNLLEFFGSNFGPGHSPSFPESLGLPMERIRLPLLTWNRKSKTCPVMTYHQISNNSNTTGVTSTAGSAYLPEDRNSPQVFCGVSVVQSLVFCIVFCRLFFVHLPLLFLAIALSVLILFTTSDYSFIYR